MATKVFGPLAQLGERLICIQEVESSTLSRSTKFVRAVGKGLSQTAGRGFESHRPPKNVMGDVAQLVEQQ